LWAIVGALNIKGNYFFISIFKLKGIFMKKTIPMVLMCMLITAQVRAGSYQMGEKVEALWHGSWYEGTIEQVPKNDRYQIGFYGSWGNREETFSPDRIREIPTRASPEIAELKSGDEVEFLEGNHWRPAVFAEVKKEKALLRYADAEKSTEQWVVLKRVWKVPQHTTEFSLSDPPTSR
jgi:hypothetical protein